MTAPLNGRYQRRFGNPGNRPSNERTDPLVEYVRWHVEQVGRFIDELEAEHGGPVSSAAESILRNHPRQPRRGEPGE